MTWWKFAAFGAIAPLSACSCACLAPGGPNVDLNEAKPDIERIYAGAFSGTITDGAAADDDPATRPACTDAGASFAVEFNVGEPVCTNPDDPTADCAKTKSGAFPLVGTLTVGDDAPRTVSGDVTVWSTDAGLQTFSESIAFDTMEYPRENLDWVTNGEVGVDTRENEGLTWTRRLSDVNAQTPIWETCALSTP